MKQVIAIGGGGFTRLNSNFALERYLLKQTKKENPKVCFLPQASAEAQDYVAKFYETFLSLKANPSWMSLFGRVKDNWKTHLLEQDLIYVGGGNTKSMLALWREWGVDKVLQEAYEKGIVLCGVSAGAICWFEQGVTDSVWPLGTLDCLGFIKGSCCPHYDTEPERRPTYLEQVKNKKIIPGIALEDNTAAHFVDGALKSVVIDVESKKAFQVSEGKENTLETTYLS